MLSWPQPDSARAGGKPDAATAAKTSGVSFARIIINVPYSAHPLPSRRRTSNESDQLRLNARGLRPGGRLVDAADETLQAKRQSTPLLFREKAAQLALAAVRLDGEPARVQARFGAAQFERPAEQRHLEPGEGQDRPEALHGEERANPTRDHAGAGKNHLRTPHAERAVRADLDAQWFAVHGRRDGNAQQPLRNVPALHRELPHTSRRTLCSRDQQVLECTAGIEIGL